MNRHHKIKLISALGLLFVLSLAVGLVLYALKQNINLFYTPTQLQKAVITPDQTIRLGGYVKDHSVKYNDSGQSVHFIVTDRKNELPVIYHGVLPNLFREGQTVVVTGQLTTQGLLATQVLAKHDEKYMPANAALAMGAKKNGP